MNPLFWGTEFKSLKAYKRGGLVAESSKFMIILPDKQKEPRFVTIEGLLLEPGLYTILMTQHGFNSNGMSQWRTDIIPRAKVLKFHAGGPMDSVEIEAFFYFHWMPLIHSRWAQFYSDDRPEPALLLRMIGIKVQDESISRS